jgi:hypothetical protein
MEPPASAPEVLLAAHERAPVGMALLDVVASPPATLIWVNPALCRMLRYEERELVGKTIAEVTYPPDLEVDLAHFERLLAGEIDSYEIEKRLLRSDGAACWVQLHASLVHGADGAPRYGVGQVVDITALKRTEEALERSEHRYRQIVESTSEGVWVLDADDVTSFVNGRLGEMLGYTPEEMVGRSAFDFLDAESREFTRARLAERRRGHADNYRNRFLHKDGHGVWVSVSGNALFDEEGAYAGSLGLFTDITALVEAERERERLQDQLHQAQRLETVGLLAGGIAHDFNNLLSVIQGYAEIAEADLADRPEALESVEEIKRATERASALTRRLLTLSRRDVSQPEVVDLRDIVRDVRNMLVRTLGKHVELELDFPDRLPPVAVDVKQLEHVLLNLAVNARDAMPDGGRLRIELAVAGGDVRMVVEDSGTGMPPEVLERAFEPFFTTKRAGAGTGLGLATVYGIVTQAGGKVSIRSEPGSGTTVVVLLPAVEAGAGPEARGEQVRPAAATGQTILVVDDEEAVRRMTARILSRHGYLVVEASGGEEALAAYRGLPAPPDLVLTDVAMPQMSGIDLARRLRGEHETPPPVLLMSGYSGDAAAIRDALGASAGFVQKPFEAAALLHRVGLALAGADRPSAIKRA